MPQLFSAGRVCANLKQSCSNGNDKALDSAQFGFSLQTTA
jgi:hypothetical protein